MHAIAELEPLGSPSSDRSDAREPIEASRALALCAASQLEQQLGKILSEFLLDCAQARDLLEGPVAPLGSLSARIRACHALALIDAHEHADCEIISRVHDEFHRSPYTAFLDSRIIGLCRRLHFRDRSPGKRDDGAVAQFRAATTALRHRLANRPFYIGHEKRTRRVWQS